MLLEPHAMTNDNANANETGAEYAAISPPDRLVLWLLVFFFVAFGGFLVGDLIVGLFR